MIKDVTIIIPTRAKLDYLKKAVSSIREKSQYDSVKILIGADNPTDEVRKWLSDNSMGQFDTLTFKAPEGRDRQGIVNVVESLVERVDTKFVYYMHDDMVIGEHTLARALRAWEPKRIISSIRVEPPIYDKAPEKVIHDLGLTASEFKDSEFLQVEEKVISENDGVLVEGFFAPHLFAKDNWVGYDHLFEPQSREDSDLALRFLENDCEVVTVRDSVVYHFSGKGSRKKDDKKDSEEWQRSNYKNTRNYVRKWGTLRHTKFIKPIKAPDIKISCHTLVGERDINMLPKFLERYEPWFNEMVFVLDGNLLQAKKVIDDYCDRQESLTPTNFSRDKIIVTYRELNGDFAAQTNHAINKCSHDWCMKLDLDEVFDEQMLNNLRFSIKEVLDGNPNVSVIGIPRINLLDGKIVNDIPREHWFTDKFHQYPNEKGVDNLDVQYRIHKRFEDWVGKVHEVPRSVYEKDTDRVAVVQGLYLTHPKSRDRQMKQNAQYNSIATGSDEPIDTFVYDSVMFTVEGITKHAREEVKLLSEDFDICLLDQNYKADFGEEFKEFYTPVDLRGDNYVTVVNQPPVRWDNSKHLKKRFGYLAFEGELPVDWVQKINESNIIELWTPSNYCKEMFKKSGVTKNVEVVPHGVDPKVWKPQSREKDGSDRPFTFLAVGTAQNDRKGFDLLVKAFSEEFGAEENVKLLFKVNKVYNPDDSFNDYLRPHINWDGNTNIEYYDKNLSEEELVKLFNESDVYVSSHRAEGFGLNILNALATATPTIVTGATGNMDFCNEDNCLLVDVEDRERWSPFIPPYDRAKWPEPSVASLMKQLRHAYENHSECVVSALEASEDVRSNWTWKEAVKAMRDRVSNYYTLSD